MWRFISHWLGGIGIIVIALSILPMLRIGGMQLFKTESSDMSDKILPKVAQISSAITIFYLVATAMCAIALRLAGMSWFDAIGHGMSALATGGFSSHDASIGYFNSATIEIIITVFMLIGSVPFVLCVQLMRGRYRALFVDSQVRVLAGIYGFSVIALTIWLILHKDMSLFYALRYVSFNTASVLSGTGFSSTDYSLWGPFAITYLFLLSVTGGCTGSTTGGIKIFRYQVFYETAKSQIQQLVRPHGIFTPHFNNRPISDNVTSSVMSFFIIFAFIFLVGSALMSLTGLDFLTSMSSTASFLANVGPGLGHIVGPAGNYADLTNSAKWLGSALMLVGRLELFTIMVLFTREFWRK